MQRTAALSEFRGGRTSPRRNTCKLGSAGKPRFHALGQTVDGRRLHVTFASRDVRRRIRATHDSSIATRAGIRAGMSSTAPRNHFGRRLGVRLLYYGKQA